LSPRRDSQTAEILTPPLYCVEKFSNQPATTSASQLVLLELRVVMGQETLVDSASTLQQVAHLGDNLTQVFLAVAALGFYALLDGADVELTAKGVAVVGSDDTDNRDKL
jgi:hypothetical protein